jgi:O-antigen/teichoic acid export membrane protein
MSLFKKIKGKLSLLKEGNYKKYLFNTSWMFLEQILRIISGLLVGIWVARFLGPEQFGIYSYAVAIVAIFGVISKFGLDSILVRELIKRPDKEQRLLGTAFWLRVFGSILAFFIIALFLLFSLEKSSTKIYTLIISGGLIFQSFEVIDYYFQSKVLSKYVTLCRIIQLSFSAVLKLYLIFIKADLVWFVLVILIDQITLGFTLSLAYFSQNKQNFYKYFSFKIAKQFLNDSWPLIFSGFVIMLYMRIDQIMIKSMLNENKMGIYAAAVRLSESYYFIPSVIANSLFPAIMNAKNNNAELFSMRLKQLYIILFWLALIIAIPVSFFSDWLIQFLYGNEFIGAGDVLSISVWAGIFTFLSVGTGQYLIAENLTKVAFVRNLVSACINIILNFIFIPIYGINGAAWATLISYFFSIFSLLFFEKSRNHLSLIFRTYYNTPNNKIINSKNLI